MFEERRLASFYRHSTNDDYGRKITFYATCLDLHDVEDIVIYAQGSGCHSLFRRTSSGTIQAGYQEVLANIVGSAATVLCVEKPGVRLFDEPDEPGTAKHARRRFLIEHTLDRWVEAIHAALRCVLVSPHENRRVLVAGHSEGGIVAARLAAVAGQNVSHVALLSSNGPTQLYDLIQLASRSERSLPRQSLAIDAILQQIKSVFANPTSISQFAWGHPYRRWSSFLSTSALDELLTTEARLFIAHGTNDSSVPVSSFDLLHSELIRHGRSVRAIRYVGLDHGFRKRHQPAPGQMGDVFRKMMEWYSEKIV